MVIKNIVLILIPTLIISGCVTTGSVDRMKQSSTQVQIDPEEIESLEMEIQELKGRIFKLESKLAGIKNNEEPVISGEGWKTLASWRKLKTGMDYESVERILGSAHRVEGGRLATWNYENGGYVIFREGKIYSWSEPY